MDVGREQTPSLWSTVTVGGTTLAKGFCSNTGDTKYLCVYRRTKLPGKGYTVRWSDKQAGDESEKRL